jgi:tripartite-type tricarboxylate transporter receptor subunit TctC
MTHARRFILTAAAVILLALSGHVARSQTASTIKIVIPVPPGGALDILTRLLAEQIGRIQGPTILIDYRSGANTVIGTEAVSRATPDGSTLLANSPAAFVITPHLRKLSYDPLTSFEPICELASFPSVIVVNSASPYRTLSDLLDAARAKPAALTLASIGPASTTHIAFEMLKRAANVNMTFVPYPGVAPAVNALLGEHVTSSFGNYRDVGEHINDGKLRALASSTRTRIESLPDVPTLAESGYKDIEVDNWFGLFAPAKTPKELISQITGWFTSALRTPEVKAKLVAQGYYPVGLCGPEFATYLRKQYDDYGRAIREANIKAE